MDFYKISNSSITVNGNDFHAVLFNYKSDEYEIYREIEQLPGVKKLLQEFIRSKPQISRMLNKRHEKLKIMYKNFLKREGIKLSSAPDIATGALNQKNIGRNQLCPCGSGKKYKKCCLNDRFDMLTASLEKINNKHFNTLKKLAR